MDPSAHESISQSSQTSLPSEQNLEMFTKLLSWRGEINDDLLARIIYEEIKSGGTRYSMFKKFEGLYGHPAMAYVNHYLCNCEKIEDIVTRLSALKNLSQISNEGSGGYVRHQGVTASRGDDTALVPLRTKVASRHSQLDKLQSAAKEASGKISRRHTYVGEGKRLDSSASVLIKNRSSHGSDYRPSFKTPQREVNGEDERHTLATPVSERSLRSGGHLEPTPPTKVVTLGRAGNQYTPEDHEYFVQYITWDLRNHPDCSAADRRCAITKVLAQNVPSHSAESWKSYWRDHPEVIRRIEVDLERSSSSSETDKSRAHGSIYATDSNNYQSSPARNISQRRDRARQRQLVMHRESGLETCSADGSDGCRPEDGMTGLSTPSRSPTPPTEVVHHQPGKHVFTDGDKAYFVRFLKWWIEKNPESDIYSNRGKIVESLSENVPSHSIGSWGNYWRRQEETIHKIVAKANRKERRCPSDDEMPSSNNPTIATLGHADNLASAKLDEPFNRAERHALAKRILFEGSYISWKDLPKDQQWYGIDPDNKLPSQSELAWSTRFERDEMGQKKIERLVEKHITKQARMSGTQVAEGDTESAIAPHSLNQSNGLDESLEAEAHQDALPSTLAIADGLSENCVAPKSDPGPSPPAKKIRIEMEEGGPESI